MLRSSLYEAALVVLTGPGRWNPLKAWDFGAASQIQWRASSDPESLAKPLSSKCRSQSAE